MVVKSYSKINLTLKVNLKLKGGLHQIQSFYCLINLFDKIKIHKLKRKRDKIKFKGPFANLVNNNKNSISNLLNILRKSKLISATIY